MPEVKDYPEGIILEKLLDSDKVKYQRALARQRLARDPDAIILEIKYHFVLNVMGRRPVFKGLTPAFDVLSDAVVSCSEAVGGFSIVLWLAWIISIYMWCRMEMSLRTIWPKIETLVRGGSPGTIP